ncbi:MAG TPA: ABC transporter ATP-binding protein [Oligoflexia bacterium]|nr:ABC transporter ATP-binding protein [Oligoflexia bacterium]
MSIDFSNFSFTYAGGSKAAIQDICHEFESGSYWCVAGANGSGKSTLLKSVCGILDGTVGKGTVKIEGREIRSIDRVNLARTVAYVPGGAGIQFPITARELIAQGRFPYKQRLSIGLSEEDETKIQSIVALLGLEKNQNRLVSQLSWGESALVMLGRALAQETKWLVLDEAVSSLDLGVQRRVFSVLEKMHRDRKVGILFVGHDLNLAAEFIPKLLWLHEGKIIKSGPFNEVLSDDLLSYVYGKDAGLSVGQNPKNGKPKIFFS